MGDRAHVILTPTCGEGKIYLYVHWNAYNLHTIVAGALARGRNRYGDPYLSRIIASDVFSAAGISDETGAGMDTTWQEGESANDVYVDTKNNTVTRRGVTYSFDEFIAWANEHTAEYGGEDEYGDD